MPIKFKINMENQKIKSNVLYLDWSDLSLKMWVIFTYGSGEGQFNDQRPESVSPNWSEHNMLQYDRVLSEKVYKLRL